MPLVRPQVAHAVHVQVVAHAAVRGAHVRVAGQHVLRRLVEAQLVEVVGDGPLPHDVALPVHLVHAVVEQLLVGDVGAVQRLVGEDERVALERLGVHARHVVAHGVALALEVGVLARHPTMVAAGVVDALEAVELPHDVAVVVDLLQVHAVLHAVVGVPRARIAHDVAARQELRRHGLHVPAAHLVAVHVEQQHAVVDEGHDGVPVPTLLRVVDGGTVREYARLTHGSFLRLSVRPYSLDAKLS